MSRPILSRPRTRVYGCNYDKGESYYKPMVDHLDRKYSGRPLFSEPRSSFADEVAARRSDIGSRDLSGPRTSARDLDLECESPRTRTQALNSLHGGGLHHEDDEDMVYDIRGQRTNRRNMAENFGSEVAETTRRFKAHAASISYDTENYSDLRRSVQQERQRDVEEKLTEKARTAMEDAETAFKRRSKLITDSEGERNAAMTRWAKLPDLDQEHHTSAATRARQTKARLDDLESEMEEMAERQAKRERRAAALRAFVNENSSAENYTMEQSSKKVAIKSRSRHLAGTRDETFDDDLDCLYDGYGRAGNPEDDIDDEFVSIQRRFKQRAANAFEEDLAELRRKRRDLQDRLFDMVDVGAEISKAKTTLDNANVAFLKHATKFDNNEEPEIEPANLVERLEKTRKVKKMVKQNEENHESTVDNGKQKKVPLLKWSKFAELENEMPKLVGDMTKARIRDEFDAIPELPMMRRQPDVNKQKQSSERRRSKKRSVIKRKKSVTF